MIKKITAFLLTFIFFCSISASAAPFGQSMMVSSGASSWQLLYDFTGGTLPGDVTEARTTVANYFNSSGVLSSAAIDVARFDYNPSTLSLRGFLVEPAATNLILQSQDTTVSPWSKSGNPTITNNNAGAPDGTSTFNHWTRTTTSASYTQQSITKAASSLSYVVTLYAKAGTNGRYLAVREQGGYPNRIDAGFDLVNGVKGSVSFAGSGFSGTSSIEAIGGGVYRCKIFLTSNTNTSLATIFSFNSSGSNQVDATDTANNSDGYVWGFMIEQVAAESSYVASAGTQGTRGADSASFTIASGVGHLSFLFDDNTSQVVAVSPGAYTIPTSLNRRWIKKIYSAP